MQFRAAVLDSRNDMSLLSKRAAVAAAAALVCGAAFVAEATSKALPPDPPSLIRHANRGCHEIALTFDLCPVSKGNGFDDALVDELAADKIPATFFASGRWIERHESAVRRLLAVPFFELETHGERHAHLPGLDADAQKREIEGPVALLRARYDRGSTFFRPPYGDYDATTLDVARTLGLRVVLWSAVSGDPDPHLSETDIVETLKPRLRDGAVVIFHANGRGLHTREVLRDIEPMLAERHLQPATLAELMRSCGE